MVNLGSDHDIQGLTATDLVDRTLAYLGDPGNERRTVTHVLSHHGGLAVPANVADRGSPGGGPLGERRPGGPGPPACTLGARTVEALHAVLREASLARAG